MKGTKIMYGNRILAQLIGINRILTVSIGIKLNWQISSDFTPHHQLTTQISACLQEQVGLMSISSCTRSFSSSPRTWLNFFMKSWAFPASGRFSAISKIVKNRISKCRKPSKKCHCALGHMRIFNSLAIFISFPNIAVLLASDCRYKGQEKQCKRETDICDYVGFFCDMWSPHTTGSLWRSSSSLTSPRSMFWHFHISFRALCGKWWSSIIRNVDGMM